MNHIEDYLSWRGDISFSVSPFNEVDSYMLAKAGTPDFTGIIPSGSEDISFKDAIDRYESLYGTGNTLGALASKGLMPMLRTMAKSPRFKDIRFSRFEKILNPEETEQFSALTMILPFNAVYIAFRGTDDTLLAWKENFYLASYDVVPAQRDALEYLLTVGNDMNCPLYIGGHSKGGNLAVYAAAGSSNRIQERIVKVWCFDGPGFRPQFMDNEGYNSILGKVETVLPEHSLVGTLLYRKDTPRIVCCDKTGVAAHDGLNWETDKDGFIETRSLSNMSIAYMHAMRRTLIPMDAQQRRSFSDAFFKILMANGAETVTDLTEQGLQKTIEMIRSFGTESETRKFVLEFLNNFLSEIQDRDTGVTKRIKQLIRAWGTRYK